LSSIPSLANSKQHKTYKVDTNLNSLNKVISLKEAEIAKNYLNTLPSELLIKIIALLPTEHYLELLHTSSALRKLILDSSAPSAMKLSEFAF
jgi:hypothetical protein